MLVGFTNASAISLNEKVKQIKLNLHENVDCIELFQSGMRIFFLNIVFFHEKFHQQLPFRQIHLLYICLYNQIERK